jgi:hypothetical protein
VQLRRDQQQPASSLFPDLVPEISARPLLAEEPDPASAPLFTPSAQEPQTDQPTFWNSCSLCLQPIAPTDLITTFGTRELFHTRCLPKER